MLFLSGQSFKKTSPMKAMMCDASRAQLCGVEFSFFYGLRTKASVWYISDSGISKHHMSGAFVVQVWGIIT